MRVDEVRGVITGAAGGMGSAFALELLRSGARIMAGDTNAAGLRRLQSRAAEQPGSLEVGRLDICEESSVSSFVSRAVESLGRVNVLINCAGIARDGLLIARADGETQGLPLAQWRKVLDVNLTGQFLITRDVATHMVESEQRDSVIVNLSSLARSGHPGQSNYAASKAGLDACTRSWALELAQYGIRVGGIAPGVVQTGFLDGFAPEAVERLKQEIPLGRLGRTEDVWQALRFILECEFFTGRVVEVDGGAVMDRP